MSYTDECPRRGRMHGSSNKGRTRFLRLSWAQQGLTEYEDAAEVPAGDQVDKIVGEAKFNAAKALDGGRARVIATVAMVGPDCTDIQNCPSVLAHARLSEE